MGLDFALKIKMKDKKKEAELLATGVDLEVFYRRKDWFIRGLIVDKIVDYDPMNDVSRVIDKWDVVDIVRQLENYYLNVDDFIEFQTGDIMFFWNRDIENKDHCKEYLAAMIADLRHAVNEYDEMVEDGFEIEGFEVIDSF